MSSGPQLAHRPVYEEFLYGLELVDGTEYDLPGATFTRHWEPDARLKLQTLSSDQVCFYRHIATVRHRPTGVFFVAFRETMDALLERQKNPDKYPAWLMHHPVKATELQVYIHVVKTNPKQLGARLRTIDDWLDAIADDRVFDTVAYKLLTTGVFTEAMYGSLR